MAKWIDSKIEFLEPIDAAAIIKKIELACRTCYKSEDKITEGSGEKLIRGCIKRGHESILEHAAVSYRVICDRGVSHEWVRHRHAAYSQESTRYCNYSKDKFGNELTFIIPTWRRSLDVTRTLVDGCAAIEKMYFDLLAKGAQPEEARAILPNCLKTELVVTMSIRELRAFLKLRTTELAHPDIRKLAIELYDDLCNAGLGVFFEDIKIIR